MAMAAVRDGYWATEIEVQELALKAWIAQARGDRTEALKLMQAAADKEDLSEKSAVSPGRLVPARELLGDMLLEDGQAPEALAAYEMSQKRDPKRFRGLWGAGQAADASGDSDKARSYYAKLVEMAGTGEPRAELKAARDWLAKH
jgi:tetratricopeptide (TPR) repeat protein